ncbi:ribonuclease activity regulator RraA [Lacibacterium aquatile]|uniref:Ribonuclease activity regulator RraA n=1 Tax=Lacibacterium aquatile TaxID=1168082 RepID=A0ABW5DTF1_9PROT
MSALTPEIRKKLATVSTATLTTLLFKRGFRNLFIQGVRPLTGKAQRILGPAYTLRHIPAREDLDKLEAFRNPEHPQRKAVESIPEGHVLVMDCRGDTTAASAGGILITRLKMRGAAGVVSDGGIRDSGEISQMEGFPVYCAGPSAPTNLNKHHCVDIGLPIACGGVPVFPGDIMLGDEDGVVVIPAHILEDIANEAAEQEIFERFVMERVSAGDTIVGLYPATNPATLDRYKEWRAAKGL